MCLAHDWNAKSHDRWWQLVFVSVLWERLSREIPANHSVLPICHMWYTRSLPTLYIPTLPTYVEDFFSKRKPLPLPLSVRDCYTHNSLHNPLWFSSTPTSPFPNPREVDSPNIYNTHPECKVRFWCCWEALEEAICLVDAIRLNCMIQRARENKTSLSQLVAGAWRARVHRVD